MDNKELADAQYNEDEAKNKIESDLEIFERQEREYERRIEEMTISPKSKEIIKLLEDYMNGGGGSHPREMRKMARAIAQGHMNGQMHRLLQNYVVKLFLMTIEEMAKLEPVKHTDPRNENARLVSSQMIDGFNKVRPGYDTKLHGRPIDDTAEPSAYLGSI